MKAQSDLHPATVPLFRYVTTCHCCKVFDSWTSSPSPPNLKHQKISLIKLRQIIHPLKKQHLRLRECIRLQHHLTQCNMLSDQGTRTPTRLGKVLPRQNRSMTNKKYSKRSSCTPKFNIAHEKWRLEDYFPIGKVTFQGLWKTSGAREGILSFAPAFWKVCQHDKKRIDICCMHLAKASKFRSKFLEWSDIMA